MKPLAGFDLWNTLAWEPLSSREYFRSLFEKYPSMDPEIVSRLVDQFIMCKPIDLTHGLRTVFQRIGIKDEAVLEYVVVTWQNSCNQAALFPDVSAVLRALRRNFKLVLITNTSQYGWEQLQKKFKLANQFDRVYLSFEVGMVKPDPRIFKIVADELEVLPRRCTMIGDSVVRDIKPAIQCGWNTLLVKGGVNRETLLRLRNSSGS